MFKAGVAARQETGSGWAGQTLFLQVNGNSLSVPICQGIGVWAADCPVLRPHRAWGPRGHCPQVSLRSLSKHTVPAGSTARGVHCLALWALLGAEIRSPLVVCSCRLEAGFQNGTQSRDVAPRQAGVAPPVPLLGTRSSCSTFGRGEWHLPVLTKGPAGLEAPLSPVPWGLGV